MITISKVLRQNNLRTNSYKKIGKTVLLNTNIGKIVAKPKNNSDIYEYLDSRSFNYYPKIVVDDTRYEFTEYIDEIEMPLDQKMSDMIKLVALLHSKTTYYKEIDFDEYKKWLNHEKMPKRICQYSLNAVFIREFDSIADASNFTGIPAPNLSLAVSGKYKQAGGYLWALKGVEHIKPYKKPCCREVCQFSLNMELLNVFESRVTAGNSIGVTPQAIGCACNSKTNISHGYIWKFKDDYEREVANGT